MCYDSTERTYKSIELGFSNFNNNFPSFFFNLQDLTGDPLTVAELVTSACVGHVEQYRGVGTPRSTEDFALNGYQLSLEKENQPVPYKFQATLLTIMTIWN